MGKLDVMMGGDGATAKEKLLKLFATYGAVEILTPLSESYATAFTQSEGTCSSCWRRCCCPRTVYETVHSVRHKVKSKGYKIPWEDWSNGRWSPEEAVAKTKSRQLSFGLKFGGGGAGARSLRVPPRHELQIPSTASARANAERKKLATTQQLGALCVNIGAKLTNRTSTGLQPTKGLPKGKWGCGYCTDANPAAQTTCGTCKNKKVTLIPVSEVGMSEVQDLTMEDNTEGAGSSASEVGCPASGVGGLGSAVGCTAGRIGASASGVGGSGNGVGGSAEWWSA